MVKRLKNFETLSSLIILFIVISFIVIFFIFKFSLFKKMIMFTLLFTIFIMLTGRLHIKRLNFIKYIISQDGTKINVKAFTNSGIFFESKYNSDIIKVLSLASYDKEVIKLLKILNKDNSDEIIKKTKEYMKLNKDKEYILNNILKGNKNEND